MKAPRVFSGAPRSNCCQSLPTSCWLRHATSRLWRSARPAPHPAAATSRMRGSHWRQPDSRGTRPTMMPEERAQSNW